MAGPILAQPASPPCTPGIPCMEYEVGTDANKEKADFNDMRRTCDGDVMNQIHARAFLEAQRENIANQIFVRKPDSVLSYTCFDEFVGVMAQKAPPLFSESTKWSGMTVPMSVTGKPPEHYPPTRTLNVNMGNGHIESLIGGIAQAPVSNFTRDNFGHHYLGDTAGFSYPVASAVNPSDRVICSTMREVWEVAKCQNFDADPFLTFEEIAAGDPRTLVGACGNQKIATTYINVAANKPPKYLTFKSGQETDTDPMFDANETAPSPKSQSVEVDGIRHLRKADLPYRAENLEDYFDPKLAHFDRVGDGCAPPIKTGVTLVARTSTKDSHGDIVTTVTPYEDSVCPTPHCYYYQHSAGGTCLPK
ncbi:MAG TPA: hypothetical protein PLO23_05570 [Alphaproteobacteria bacterium]|nr:hypothetical protein [Alphaproteobacteria bacterium]